ncbi:MAG: phosphoribosylamine--glycine ligase [Treponemataceae bacterium]|nr:phosphoribosylamine--glycine ligase [Treponemataceae bacterium]
MRFLVIGSGGREHAIAWKLAQSKEVEQVFVYPGNGGTAQEKKCQNLTLNAGNPDDPASFPMLAQWAGTHAIDLTVVGPEAPLASGIVDYFRSQGLAIVGPTQVAARLESSKAFAKEFMKRYGVRTAPSWTTSTAEEALEIARSHFEGASTLPPPLVIKADGLAAGKGVVIAQNLSEAITTIESFMRQGALGAAGKTLVIEKFLPGKEVSVLAAVSVQQAMVTQPVILPFKSARDHKRRYDGAQGPNTGGMGAISPVDDFSLAAEDDFIHHILKPTLHGMITEGFDYRGFIFFGLMVCQDTCYLLEYNVRLGDPETQAVLPLMESDFAALCTAIEQGMLASFELRWEKGYVCAPVAVAEGYPGPYRKGDPVRIDWSILESIGAQLFIAGAQQNPSVLVKETAAIPPQESLITSGGRVLAVSASGATLAEAQTKAYRALEAISFPGMGYRRDIGSEIGLS